MILRLQFRGSFTGKEKDFLKALEDDKITSYKYILKKECLTVALFSHKTMLFMYYEALNPDLKPQQLFPKISKLLNLWPERDGLKPWAKMYQVYYHAIPEDTEEWLRERLDRKKKIGRITYLKPEKMFSYISHHNAIVEEGLFDGDKYQSIAIHENLLFSYYEEPRTNVHIKKELHQASKEIGRWEAADPYSHFDHTFCGTEDNFFIIHELFSAGA